MTYTRNYILAGTLLLFCIPSKGQFADSLSALDIIHSTILTDRFEYKAASQFNTKGIYNIKAQSILLSNSVKEGIFCRWEDQIIEQSKLPIRFRLGSLEYTDHLEGKWSDHYQSLPNRP
jgi:hypothetical protein